jgi:flagellar motor switch protein FliG
MAIAALRKAAVFLGSLPDEQAAGLLAKLSPEQAAAVSAEAAAMGPVNREEQEAVIQEFAACGSSQADNGLPTGVSPFTFLQDTEANDLLGAIGNEHPQTIALILSQLPAEQAAGVIALLSPDQQASVIARIAKIDQPSQEIVAEVAEAVHRRLAGPVRIPVSRGMSRVVKMFGSMRPKTERKLLGGIAQADPELLRAIRRAMFGPDVAACGEWNLTAAAS